MASELTISWSALKIHEQCRFQAHALRTQPKTPDQNIRSYFHGTVVDRVMRTWLQNDPQPGEMPEMVRDFFDICELEALKTGDGVVRYTSAKDKDDLIRFCVELVTRLEPILFDKIVQYPYDPAKRFRVPIQVPFLSGEPTRIWLAGEIDLMARPDWYTLWDLKGTKNDSYWRSVYGQIIFYDIAMGIMYGEHPKEAGLIQPMCKQRVLPLPVTDELRTQMLTRILRMASDMWAKDQMIAKDSKPCFYCPVKGRCPKYQPMDVTGNVRRVSWGVQRGSQQSSTEVVALPPATFVDGAASGDEVNSYG